MSWTNKGDFVSSKSKDPDATGYSNLFANMVSEYILNALVDPCVSHALGRYP